MKRTTIIICLAAIMLLALAVPAFADGYRTAMFVGAALALVGAILSWLARPKLNG